MEAARTLEARAGHSPLAAARLRRQLALEEAAALAGISADEATWLEEGRVYRFRSPDQALLACVLYAAALEVDLREAREMAGLPTPPRRRGANPLGRLIAVGALAAMVSGLIVGVTFTTFDLGGSTDAAPRARQAGPRLPAPWRIQVDVLNGSGDINYTRRVADRISALGYTVERVARADRFDYPQTVVFYEPGGRGIAARLARQLEVTARPLPGGKNPLRLVVVVGPGRLTG